MPRILFIAAHRPGRSPSQRFRFEQYLDHILIKGYQYDISYLVDEKNDPAFYSPGNYPHKLWLFLKSGIKRIQDVLKASSYDIIFIQREAFMTGSVFFEKLFSRSKAKLIFDFDDALWLPNVSEGNKNLEWLKNYDKTAKIISLADAVIAGNSFLADFAAKYNRNVKIIPTTIDTSYHVPKAEYRPDDKICIGWTGTSTTLSRHFSLIVPVLKKIKSKYGDRICFRVIADVPYAYQDLPVESMRWNIKSEIQDLSAIDIGIMPLPDDEWSRGKCGFKGLQYMALGIPAIMSSVGVNEEIVSDGINGFLARSEKEWLEKLSLLIESFELRQTIGSNARAFVEQNYSVEVNLPVYLECLEEVISS